MPELCTDWLKVDCPPGGPHCRGVCLFRACARYDAIPDSTDIRNLVLVLEGQSVADPFTDPELIATGARACKRNFNAGRGYLEYVGDGTVHRLDNDALTDAANATPAGQADRDRRDRIRAQGHCEDWSEADRVWMAGHGFPTHVGGWNLTWDCQSTEGGSGMSVRQMQASHAGPIQSFDFAFEIDVSCFCGRLARNGGVLVVRLKYPPA